MTTVSVRVSGDVRPSKALHVGLWVVQGLPMLTPLAGVGLAIVLLLATMFHISRGELGALPIPLVLAGLAAFVAWGRVARVRLG